MGKKAYGDSLTGISFKTNNAEVSLVPLLDMIPKVSARIMT